jgi:hypothetical protein
MRVTRIGNYLVFLYLDDYYEFVREIAASATIEPWCLIHQGSMVPLLGFVGIMPFIQNGGRGRRNSMAEA